MQYESQFRRISKDFCPDCKFNKESSTAGCPHFTLDNGICGGFQWKSKVAQEKYEDEVRHNRAVTRWIEKGKPLREIWEMSEAQLLSILPKNTNKPLEAKSAIQADKISRATPNQTISKTPPTSKTNRAQLNKQATPNIQYKHNLLTRAKQVVANKNIQSDTTIEHHYITCKLENGKTKVFSRTPSSKYYQTDLDNLRKHIKNIGAVILSEEIR